MTGLNVPLTVRIGDKHVTSQVADIAFRKEAVGGVRNLTVNLLRGIDNLDADLAPFTKVYFYDGRTAETVAEGRLADSGRSADAGGQSWDIVAFGPVQHASDFTTPLIYIDTDLSAWREIRNTREANVGVGAKPDAAAPGGTVPSNGVVMMWPPGTTLANGDVAAIRYERIAAAAQKLGGYQFLHDEGGAVANATVDAIASTGGDWAVSNAVPIHNWSATLTLAAAGVVTDFSNGRDFLDLRMNWNGGEQGTGGGWWTWIEGIVVQALRYAKAGTEITTGYTLSYIQAHQVVDDLLGRGVLGDYDGTNATVDTTGSFLITQLAYPDNTTPAQVLEDLMKLEPSHRWYTTPDTTGGGYGFRWELWPTTVRYEATLDDGGSFPVSAQSLYNRVVVRWNDGTRPRLTLRTMAVTALDDLGLIRQATLDLGSEVGALAQAEQAGDTFLAQHNVPKNSGSIRVARPIRDVISGRMVDPWEIEPGELIRVRGVESYTDSLNASSNDGQSVFRIWSMDYSSADNSANLALDGDPADLTSALVKLLNERQRA